MLAASLRVTWCTHEHVYSKNIAFLLVCEANLQMWLLLFALNKYESRHDKTNKVTVRPANTQISLRIRPVWSDSSLCAQWVAKDLSFLHADSKDSLGAHSFCWFCHVAAHIEEPSELQQNDCSPSEDSVQPMHK